MATYGRRKKALLPSFSVFQDQKPEHEPKLQRRPSTRDKAMSSPSGSRFKRDDDSIDELAGTVLLDHVVPEPSQHSVLWRHASVEDLLRQNSYRSSKSDNGGSGKPLPLVPAMPEDVEPTLPPSRPVLAVKTSNLKVTGSGIGRTPKSKVYLPTSQLSHFSPHPSLIEPGPDASRSQTSIAKAAELSEKISDLMQQAAAQESETKKRALAYADASIRPSPLQRGKKAFVKVTRALKERLSNNSNSTRRREIKRRISSPPSSSSEKDRFEKHPLSDDETEDDDQRGRFGRRIAEGTNLANPKIRSLTGDGNIPRKPLPVYESMRARARRSALANDPFSDGNGTHDRQNPYDYSEYDFNFDKRKNKGKRGHDRASSSARMQRNGDSKKMSRHLRVPQQDPRFSNKVSGLSQHSDTTLFSSSPIAFSTPQYRLDSQPMIEGRSSTTGLVRSPSILEFSFEGCSEDERSPPASANSKSATDGSVKRKNANDDHRTNIVPAIKRARLSSSPSNDEVKIASKFHLLNTQDDLVSYCPEDGNSRTVLPLRRLGKGKGLGIFEVGKGKGPEKRDGKDPRLPRLQVTLNKRNLSARPRSGLFGHESRTGMRKLAPSNADSMDIDELQIDDS